MHRLAFLTILTAALPAYAAPTAQEQSLLATAQHALEDTVKHLPAAIKTSDPIEYQQKLSAEIDPVLKAADHAADAVFPNMNGDRDTYNQTWALRKQIVAYGNELRSLLAIGKDLAELATKEANGQFPLDEELRWADAATNQLAKATANDAWAAPHIATIRALIDGIKSRRAEMVKQNEEKAKQKALEAHMHDRAGLTAEALQQSAQLEKALLAGSLTDEALAPFEANIRQIETLSEGAAWSLRAELAGIKLVRAWQTESDPASVIAAQLGGTLESKGQTSGTKLDIKVKGAAERCYLVVGTFASQADTSGISGFTWTVAGDRQVQEFHIKPFPALAEGFCTLSKAETVTAHADLTFAGTKNGVRYAVVSFGRDQIPADLSAHFVLERGDQCDPAYWEAIWTHPIAGTLAYAGGREPVLVMDAHGEVIWLNDPTSLKSAGMLTSKPTSNVGFSTPKLEWGSGCPTNQKEWLPAKSAVSKKIVACYAKVHKKYGGTWDQIDGQRAAAANMGGIAPAVENRATALMKQQDRDAAACDKIDESMHKTLEKLNDKLIDALVAAPPVDASGRAELISKAR